MDRNKLWGEKRDLVKRMNDIHTAASAESRSYTQEEQGQYDAAADRVQEIEQIMERDDAHQERLRALNQPQNTRNLNDPDGDSGEQNPLAAEPYRRAHNRYLRVGGLNLRQEDREVLRAGTDASFAENRTLSGLVGQNGGYLVPPSFLNEVRETQKFFGGAIQAGPQILNTASGEDIMWPTNDDTGVEGELLGEGGTVSTADVTFGQKKISAYIGSSKLVKVPTMLLNDAEMDIESFLGRKFGMRLGRLRNRLFTVGTGASQPQGMVTGATSGVTAASATAIVTTELIDLEHSVDPAYRDPSRCKYMWADGTLKILRKLTDGAGRPLWEPSLKEGVPSTLNGYQYIVNNDMPAATASNKAILFGDFEAYYLVRNVSGLLVVRLNELYALSLQVGFFAVERFDGGVQDSSAVRAMTMHA